MQSARELLEEIAGKNNGILTLRNVMGATGEVHRHRAKLATELVKCGFALWANPQQTMVQISSAGLRSLEE